MRSRTWAWAREPLLHFLLLGAAIFVIDRVLAPAASPDACERELERVLVVDDERIAALEQGFAKIHGAPPSATELIELTERWIDEQLLYREGLALGLDRDDGTIRRRVADKMAFVLASQTVIEPPSEAELAEFHAAHADDYASSERLDFVHVYFAGHSPDAADRAAAALQLLERGADPAGLGDRFSGGRRYRKRSLAELERSFGPAFVEGLDQQGLGIWTRRTSRFGVHLVAVEARAAARVSSLADARERIESDVLAQRSASAAEQAMQELRERWIVERP